MKSEQMEIAPEGLGPPRLPVRAKDSAARERAAARTLEWLGLANGLLFGLALALGAYLPEALALGESPVQLVWPVAGLGAGLVVATATLAGWLGGRLQAGYAAPLAWVIAAMAIILIVGHIPYEGRTLVVWLADGRFWGRALYPFDEPAQVRMLIGGFFIGLGLVVPGLLQDYRMEAVRAALSRGRLTLRAALLLLMPLPLVAAAGYAADNNVSQPLRAAPLLVEEAIQTARTYEGDLAALGRERGVNYSAVNGVLDLIGEAEYTLMLGAMDLGAAQTVYVVAHFDNGAWVNCRVLAGQLSHCYDASRPYSQGLAGALSGAGTPECQACSVRVDAATSAWLIEHGRGFTSPPIFTRLAQWGSHVLVRAHDAASGYAVECWFEGLPVVEISGCMESRVEE
jgi:hypothetical protein